MPSPFPGMDPYLEHPDRWSDFHLTIIVAMRADLNAKLPRGLRVSADRHVWVEDAGTGKRMGREPDAFVVPTSRDRRDSASSAAAVAAPLTVTLPRTEHKGRPYLRIVDKEDRRLVTAIEFLSPANKKRGKDRDAYLTKREEYQAARINLVEFNLLRTGAIPPFSEDVEPSDYYVMAARASNLPQADFWPFSIRDPFPEFPIPLREREAIAFSLGPCFDRAFAEARYDDEINYRRPPVPRLKEPDASWARERIKTYLTT